jgi:ribosomal protein S18 acetylase RimI-like enzyme
VDQSSAILYRTLEARDFPACLELWQRTPGMGIRSSDNQESFSRFLDRNPGMSFAAVSGTSLAATVMCGHDGRRGYIYHLAVDPAFRRRGIGSGIVDLSLSALREEKIDKCTLFVFDDNETGVAFWSASGWTSRSDLLVWQKNL